MRVHTAIRVGVVLVPVLWMAHTVRMSAQNIQYSLLELMNSSDADFVARGLNNAGHIVGRTGSYLGSGTRAFIWTGNSNLAPIVGLDPRQYSAAFGINDLDEIAGSVNNGTSIQGFMATPAQARLLTPLPGDNSSQAFAINKAGEIVGYSTGANGQRACLWARNGSVQNLGVLPGGDSSKALDISDSGDVVGTSTSSLGTRAFLWTRAEGMLDLGVLAGDSVSEAFAVNAAGQVVGYSKGPKGMHAFLWKRAGGMRDLGVLPGTTDSRALNISNSGQVVGTSASSTGARAFLWTNKDGMTDLNLSVPVNLGLVLIEAHAINGRGQIVALGTDAIGGHGHEGPNRLLLLTPGVVPPGS